MFKLEGGVCCVFITVNDESSERMSRDSDSW